MLFTPGRHTHDMDAFLMSVNEFVHLYHLLYTTLSRKSKVGND